MKSIRTVIIAKAPLPGLAKTRLIPVLGLEGSAMLAKRLLINTVTQVIAANIGRVELCVTPSIDHPIWATLGLPSMSWSEQAPGDLGDRLADISKRVITIDDGLLLLGSDCPELNATVLREAATALESNDTCMVPVVDGGYALLGVKEHIPDLFSHMPWSTSQVAELTQARIEGLGYSFKKLPMLNDIDLPCDLQALPLEYLPLWQDL